MRSIRYAQSHQNLLVRKLAHWLAFSCESLYSFLCRCGEDNQHTDRPSGLYVDRTLNI